MSNKPVIRINKTKHMYLNLAPGGSLCLRNLTTIEVFFLLFLNPSGVTADKQTEHFFLGSVRQAIVGTELEVPVPKNTISSTVAIGSECR